MMIPPKDWECRVCGRVLADGPLSGDAPYELYCDDHYRCEDCGTRDGLHYWPPFGLAQGGLLCNDCHSVRIGEWVRTGEREVQQ